MSLALKFDVVSPGMKHDTVGANHDPTPPLWRMSGAELSLIVFATVLFTVPSGAATSVRILDYITSYLSFDSNAGPYCDG